MWDAGVLYDAGDGRGAGDESGGAEELLGELEKKGAITEVIFKSDKVKKFTIAKAKEQYGVDE